MLDPNLDFKEQMAEVRRTQILMGAAEVFAQKGFHKATTKEIARAAGVAEGTIYNYFDNKRELLLAMVEMIGAQTLKNTVLDHPPDDPKAFFTMILRDRLNLLQERGQHLAPLIAEIFSDPTLRHEVYSKILMPLAALMEEYLQHHVQTGKFRPINPVIITRAMIGTLLMNGAIKYAQVDPRYDDITTEALIEELVSLLLDGVLAPPRLTLLP